jgi:outer membrane protein insertion porin family
MLEGASEIKRFYVERGYLEAQIEPSIAEQGDTVAINYEIHRGRRIEFRLDGAGREEKRVRSRLVEIFEEALFTEDLLEEAAQEIAQRYREQGYYTVLVDRTSEVLGDGTLRVVFRIDPGELVRVEGVTITGNLEIPEERVRRQMLTTKDTLFSRSLLRPSVVRDDVAAIRNLYLQQGFIQARVEPHVTLSPDGKRAALRIVIQEAQRARTGSISFEGRGEVPEKDLLEALPLKPGDPYNPALAREGEVALRRLYDRIGFPDVTVSTHALRSADDVSLTYRIEPGEKQTIRRVVVEGDARTSDNLVRRELQLEPGMPVSREAMREAQQRLYRLGVFEGVSVQPEPAPAGKEGKVIHVRLQEAKDLLLGLGAGYDSEDGPRGILELADVNFRGHGRYVGFQARASAREDRVQGLLKERRLFGKDGLNSIMSAFWERQEREGYEFRRIGSSLQVGQRHSPILGSFLRYSINVYDVALGVPQDLLEEVAPKQEPGRLRLASAGGAVIRDSRDNPFSPSRGVYLSADARVFAEALGSEETFGKVFLQGTYQKRLGSSVVFATSARLGLAPRFGGTPSVPLVERFFAGGDTTVRGFPRDLLGSNVLLDPAGTIVRPEKLDDTDGDGTEERVGYEDLTPLGGEALLVLNQELRIPIRGQLEGVVFYDAGNTYRRLSDLDVTKLRDAIGLGLRLETPIGPVRLEYGHKLGREPGEGRGQFYISIGPAF